MTTLHRCAIVLGMAIAVPAIAGGQARKPTSDIGGPLTGTPVAKAPFSADALTTLRVKLLDGTSFNQRSTAHYYRDGAGRARVEMRGNIPAGNTIYERHARTMIAPDGKDGVYSLDPVSRTIRYLPRQWIAYAAGGESFRAALTDNTTGVRIGGLTFAVPIAGDGKFFPVRFLLFRRAQDLLASGTLTVVGDVTDESLGTKEIENLKVVGRRVTMTVPVGGELGNLVPFDLVDERWESHELKLLVSGRFTDSRLGTVDYQLTNVRLGEPDPNLFVVPEDYATEIPEDFMRSTELKPSWVALMHADRYPKVGMSTATVPRVPR